MSDSFIDLYVKSISKEQFMKYLEEFIADVNDHKIEIGDDMAKVATQLKWGKTLLFDKRVAFSTFLSVATYIYGTLSIVPSLWTKYWTEDERLKLIIKEFTVILESVKSNTIGYKSPLTTNQFKEWKSIRESYDWSQTKLQKPLYDVLQKARVWYNTRSSYKTELETKYAEKLGYCERRMNEVNERITFCKQSVSQACKDILPTLLSTLDTYKRVHSSLVNFKHKLDQFDSSSLEEDKLLKEYQNFDTALKKITVPPFEKNERLENAIREELKIVANNLQKLRNRLEYWKETSAFLLLQSVHQNYTNLKQILPQSIDISIAEKDYKNINDIVREIELFLEMTKNVDLSNVHEIQEQINNYDEKIQQNIRIPLLDNDQMYSKTLTQLATFEDQHQELVKQSEELELFISQLEKKIPDLENLKNQLKTLEYLESGLKYPNTIKQGQDLLNEFETLRKSFLHKSFKGKIEEIQHQIDLNKRRETQLNRLLFQYNAWIVHSYEALINEAHIRKVLSLRTLKKTYTNQINKLQLELDDSKKWIVAYKKRPGIDSFTEDIEKYLNEIDRLKDELNNLIQSIQVDPDDRTKVLNESDLSQFTTSFVNRAEELKKEIQKKIVLTREFTLCMEKKLSDSEKPPESRVWESPTGQTWSKVMDKIFTNHTRLDTTDQHSTDKVSTGQVIKGERKQHHWLEDNDMLKRNIVLAAGSIGLTAAVYYLYWKGKQYYTKKKLIHRIESLKPKLMWIVIQPYSRDTLRPVNVFPTSDDIYTNVINVIETSLRPSTRPILKKIPSKTSKPSYGVQILMSSEVIPDVQVYLLGELKRKGLTNDSLIKIAPKSSSRVVLPILV